MVEDIAEKARRNLMLLATGIIVVWLLGIPLQGHLIGAVNLDSVEPYRAWLCAAGALGYFLLRYHLAPTNAAERKKWKGVRQGLLKRRFENLVAREYLRFKSGTANEVTFTLKKELEPGNTMGAMSTPRSTIFTRGYRGGSFHFEVMRTFFFKRDHPEGEDAVSVKIAENLCGFSIPLRVVYRHRALNTYAAYRNLSWNSLEITLPYVWTAIAALVCIAKIASSLYYEFPFVRQLLAA